MADCNWFEEQPWDEIHDQLHENKAISNNELLLKVIFLSITVQIAQKIILMIYSWICDQRGAEPTDSPPDQAPNFGQHLPGKAYFFVHRYDRPDWSSDDSDDADTDADDNVHNESSLNDDINLVSDRINLATERVKNLTADMMDTLASSKEYREKINAIIKARQTSASALDEATPGGVLPPTEDLNLLSESNIPTVCTKRKRHRPIWWKNFKARVAQRFSCNRVED